MHHHIDSLYPLLLTHYRELPQQLHHLLMTQHDPIPSHLMHDLVPVNKQLLVHLVHVRKVTNTHLLQLMFEATQVLLAVLVILGLDLAKDVERMEILTFYLLCFADEFAQNADHQIPQPLLETHTHKVLTLTTHL